MKNFLFLFVVMFGSIETASASFNAYIEFMDIVEGDKINLYLSNVEDSKVTCASNIIYLGYAPEGVTTETLGLMPTTTSNHLYTAALTAMTAGKMIRLHSENCVTKRLRTFK